MAFGAGSNIRHVEDVDAAARALFSSYKMQHPRWTNLTWEELREETRRMLRREVVWRLHEAQAARSR
jgi:hypothetical protein